MANQPTAQTHHAPLREDVSVNYITSPKGIMSWLTTVDHKRIGIMYLWAVLGAFLLGGLFALALRIELLTPKETIMTAETYNKVFTLHGVIMVFLFIIPSIPAALGNFVLPLMLGAKDVAFPRLNLASYYIYMLGAVMALSAIIFGGIDTGWTFYTPYSTTTGGAVSLMTLAVFVLGFSSIFTGINFIATIHKLRAPGMGWFQMPLFCWSMYATSLIQVLATPVLGITLLLLVMERVFNIGIFDPKLGGDPVLFQHFFWFYSHPAVYIMILPAMGVVSEIIAAFARKPVFGYHFVAFSSIAIAVLGFLVWAHHMFVAGISVYAAAVFSVLSMLVAIPSAVKVFNWTTTLYKGSISWETPMLYALGFIGLFTIGGLTGVMLATLGIELHVHDTYFIIAHFHYIMVGGAIMAYMGGLHYWWPKITGKLYPKFWSTVSALLVFVGFNVTFFPQFILGYLGMPRRYHAYPAEFQVLNVMSSAGATVLGLGYLIPAIYLIWSMRYGKDASANPWGAVGLDWKTSSPPPVENFDTPPVVTWGAYEYHDPHATASLPPD